jgi:hypothetical protein
MGLDNYWLEIRAEEEFDRVSSGIDHTVRHYHSLRTSFAQELLQPVNLEAAAVFCNFHPLLLDHQTLYDFSISGVPPEDAPYAVWLCPRLKSYLSAWDGWGKLKARGVFEEFLGLNGMASASQEIREGIFQSKISDADVDTTEALRQRLDYVARFAAYQKLFSETD